MEGAKELDAAKEVLTEYLTINGLRKTPERYAILETLYKVKKHVSADELHDMMESSFKVSRGTVYSTLETLYNAHLAIRHQFDTATVYERIPDKPHYHMICTECGIVSEFYNVTLKNALSTIKIKGFSISDHKLYVYGTCTKCKQRLGRLKKKLNKQDNKL